MERGLAMSRREQRGSVIATELDARQCTGTRAAEVLGLSLRQVRRLVAAFWVEGAAGLAHPGRQTLAVYQFMTTGPVPVGEFKPADLPEPAPKPVAQERKARMPAAERWPYKPPADHPWRQPFAAKRRR
jgi:hypothetical protein